MIEGNSLRTHDEEKPKSRIASLDGLRCVAVVAVALYHYLGALPKQTPTVAYGDTYANLLFVQYGHFGVQLFFAISGFVIIQSLHNSATWKTFGVRRVARLWPTMLLCSILTYLFSFIGSSYYAASIYNFLPSLTFLDPKLFNYILGRSDIDWMDGAYWTMFAEVRFYILAAIIFFIDKRNFFRYYLVYQVILGTVYAASMYLGLGGVRSGLYHLAIANFLPFFTIGIGFYFFYCNERIKAFTLISVGLLLLLLFQIAALGTKYMVAHERADVVVAVLIVIVIVSSFKINFIKNLLSSKLMSSIGVASYSLYLLHQGIGENIIVYIGNPLSFSPQWSILYVMFVLVMMMIASILIYYLYENPANKFISSFFIRKSVQLKK